MLQICRSFNLILNTPGAPLCFTPLCYNFSNFSKKISAVFAYALRRYVTIFRYLTICTKKRVFRNTFELHNHYFPSFYNVYKKKHVLRNIFPVRPVMLQFVQKNVLRNIFPVRSAMLQFLIFLSFPRRK